MEYNFFTGYHTAVKRTDAVRAANCGEVFLPHKILFMEMLQNDD